MHNVGQLALPEANEDGSYSKEQLTELLESRDRQWQSSVTPLQQERATLHRHLATANGQIEAFKSLQGQPPNTPTGESSSRSDEVPQEWVDGITDGPDLFRAVNRLWDERAAQARPDTRVAHVESEVEEMRLDGKLSKLQIAYPWMDEEHVGQVLQAAFDSGNDDLMYVAWKIHGEPSPLSASTEQNYGDGDGTLGPEQPRHQPTRKRVMAGAASSGQGPGAMPKTVKIRRGAAGYGDAEAHVVKWMKQQGRD